jgi:rSAM/selenodomain-associated transferase 2
MNVEISVIIPVVDEASIICKTVSQFTKHEKREWLQVIVVDGGSKDNTVSLAESEGALVLRCDKRSRATQMNLGASKAKHPILYFVHADVQAPESFYDDILASVKNGFQSGCYRSGYDRYPGLMRLNSFMTRFNIISFRGGDQTLFITKEAYQKLNGFDEYFSIMEDYNLIERIWKTKVPFELIQKDVIISSRKYEKNSWLRVQIANGVAMYMFKRGESPEEIKRAYKKLLNYKPDNYSA